MLGRTQRVRAPRIWSPLVLASALGLGCSGEDALVGTFSATSGGGAGSGGAAGSGSCVVAECQGHIYQCGDCLDNDGDGATDADDPECVGPCDNTEDSYYGAIPGQNNSPCRQDCYFDQDTGPGNDECYWSHRCDPLSLTPDYPPSGDPTCSYEPGVSIPGTVATCAELRAVQTGACESYCGPLTPNGCDCFGCCELPAKSGRFVWLGSTAAGVGSCDATTLADPSKCKPCTPVAACFNACDPCEVCVGKVKVDEGCGPADGGSGLQCAEGIQACGQPKQQPCPAGEYCITGCCIAVPK